MVTQGDLGQEIFFLDSGVAEVPLRSQHPAISSPSRSVVIGVTRTSDATINELSTSIITATESQFATDWHYVHFV